MYLVLSYYAELCDATIAIKNYDVNYASSLQNNNFYGVQFHPEKAVMQDEVILNNFLKL